MEKISLQPWKVDNYDSFMLKYTLDFRLAMLISILFIIIKTCSNLYEFDKIALTKFCLQKKVTKNWEEKFLSMCHCILMYVYEVACNSSIFTSILLQYFKICCFAPVLLNYAMLESSKLFLVIFVSENWFFVCQCSLVKIQNCKFKIL